MFRDLNLAKTWTGKDHTGAKTKGEAVPISQVADQCLMAEFFIAMQKFSERF
ncbi:hypothetical protein [Roseovarius sp. MBR-51]